ncbi:MAG: DUF423 domain-containing protein [Bacteroidetes bacterium]|nr:MAG: DUF423 domain-containing protein [Bacteroidota bacterium]MBL1145852.1 DUF423 domain-containing protein [Bacteroidota bacterium]MCB0802502.1 DUF423 domain-containing protein [Flavobacteriales bacterium]NOG58646.1 DUF423 domain-containing protein [Bacteroidota bacterium]
MTKKLISLGAVFGALAVIFGAFGAHALKGILSFDALQAYETGVRYQIIHALLLVILGFQSKIDVKLIGKLIVWGILFFSFSIYLLSFKDILGWPALKYLGPITPIGGLLLLTSWVLLIFKSTKLKQID